MRIMVTGCRVVLSAIAVAAAVVATWWLAGDDALELARALRTGGLMSPAWTVDMLVRDLAAVLGLVAVAGLVAELSLSATAVVVGRRLPRLSALCERLSPRVGRQLIATCCGIGLVAPVSLGVPALADSGGHHQTCDQPCRYPRDLLAGLGLPDLPARSAVREGTVGQRQVVVRTGDSLWRIAERRLPRAASDADIEALSRRLYAVNRSTIGDDPDLIFPGMTLTAPEGNP